MKQVPYNIAVLLEKHATFHEKAEAIVMGNERYSYADVYRQVRYLAAYLTDKGIRHRSRVALLAEGSPRFLFSIFACWQIGAIAVPINTRLSEGEIVHVLKDTKPSLFIASANYLTLAQKTATKMKDLPIEDMEHVFSKGKDKEDNNHSKEISADSPCLIIHTAAVGGKPRGAVLTHANLISTAVQLAHLLNLTEEDRHLCLLPLFHIGGLAFSLATIMVGGKNVISPRFEPEKVPEIIEREQITFFITFPPMLSAILDAEKKENKVSSSLRLVGGVDTPETIEQFLSIHPGSNFYHIYGQTECMPVSGGIYRAERNSIGHPTLLTHISIRDEDDRELPIGKVGEICVRSPSVFLGYWRLKEETNYTMRGGWHHTGDLGQLLPNGTLIFSGRKPEKDLIKTGGENVYPREVEQVILTHTDIKEVCVIGVPDEKWGETVVAVCTLRENKHLSEDEIISYVAARIARYKRPRRVLIVADIPKKPDGSVDRARVKQMGVELLAPPQKGF
ncbi:MAG: AMP-binding protein [Syntrophales bacterium]|nr:AMP-binding protein [Syntrophales bacterium]